MPHPTFHQVRERYNYRCGYCGISEADAGGELTIDHYRPKSQGGDDSDDNLVYACSRCNQYKAGVYPTAEQLAVGHQVLHPLLDDATQHVREDELTGRLEPLTATGRFHVDLLRLNRPALVQHRVQKRLTSLLERRVQELEIQLAESLSSLAAQEAYIRRLSELLAGEERIDEEQE